MDRTDAGTGRRVRGRLAPSPTGYLHLGHARTFWTAQARVRAAGGVLVLRNDDLDGPRCRPEYVEAAVEDLKWFGFRWDEGPDVGGAFGPYSQSERVGRYRAAFERLREEGRVFPCVCSRKEILRALSAPHPGEEEPVYPGTCRDRRVEDAGEAARVAWRFRVEPGESVCFVDGRLGPQTFRAGVDFGDFVVWRGEGLPSYQLACVVDDAGMGITEVVRGADLLLSTARQCLLYRALGWSIPAFFHCPLMNDERGVRLAKRHDALSLRRMREAGADPASIRAGWESDEGGGARSGNES